MKTKLLALFLLTTSLTGWLRADDDPFAPVRTALDHNQLDVADAPNRAEYQSNLGRILGQRTGEVSFIKQALLAGQMFGAFKKSVELDPNHIPGYIGLARYYTNAPA